MTDTIIIYGHSDDLIEVEGAVNLELNPPYDEDCVIECSDGRRFSVAYDGDWHIECLNPDSLHTTDYSDVAIYPAGTLEVFNDYSDVVIYRSWDGVESVELVE